MLSLKEKRAREAKQKSRKEREAELLKTVKFMMAYVEFVESCANAFAFELARNGTVLTRSCVRDMEQQLKAAVEEAKR